MALNTRHGPRTKIVTMSPKSPFDIPLRCKIMDSEVLLTEVLGDISQYNYGIFLQDCVQAIMNSPPLLGAGPLKDAESFFSLLFSPITVYTSICL